MNTPHKWRDVIVAWADGRSIEQRVLHQGPDNEVKWTWWCEVKHTPEWNSTDREFRIKPDPLRYRVALMRNQDGDTYTATADSRVQFDNLDGHGDFIRWLTDWVEYDA